MVTNKQYGGSTGSPIQLRTNRQTEEQVTTNRYRQPRPRVADDEELDDGWTAQKPHTSAVRYDLPVQCRTAEMNNPKKTRLIKQRRFDRWTFITWLCIAIIVMVGGWFIFSKIADWWTGVHDTMVYGTPFRTFQADQYVGMGDTPDHPDHFIALKLHGVIEIVQINLLDRHKDALYVLANVGNDSTPASLSFRDTTGSGHIDVIVTIGDTTPYTVILINDGKTLTPTQPAH